MQVAEVGVGADLVFDDDGGAERLRELRGAITRANGSLTAPGVNGTTMVTVLPANPSVCRGFRGRGGRRRQHQSGEDDGEPQGYVRFRSAAGI